MTQVDHHFIAHCLKLAHSPATAAPWLCHPQRGIQGCTGTEIWVSPKRLPSKCIYGKPFNTNNALNCPTGGFPTVCHNEARDLLPSLLTEVCSDVAVEPALQPITGDTFQRRSTSTDNGARLDIQVRGFW